MQGIDHYENFPVASWLCPAHLRPAVLALYHFARTADDLADEGDAPADERLQQLQQYRQDLQTCLRLASTASTLDTTPLENTQKPMSQQWPQVFTPLAVVVARHALPHELLFDLLDAFEQDVVYTRDGRRYASQEELLDYCRRSANPVGRLLLHLYGVHSEEALRQSDAICSSLQLINFWQDRVQDYARGRNYLPLNSAWSEQLIYARACMQAGAPLVHQVKGRAGWELRLVVQGGLRILSLLEKRYPQHDPLDNPSHFKRPKLQASDVGIMLWRAFWM
jgi:squalene synthase HpnC